MLVLILGLVLFLGIHSVRMIAPQVRAQRIAAMGEGRWKGIYAATSAVGLILIVLGYGIARQHPVVFWVAPSWGSHLVALLMIPSLVLIAASQLPSGHIKAAVKHPQLLAIKIWATAHLIVNGDLASLLLFGSFLVWAIAVRISEKRRFQRGETRNPVAGPVKWDAIAVVAGLALYAALVLGLHFWLFGVQPIAVS